MYDDYREAYFWLRQVNTNALEKLLLSWWDQLNQKHPNNPSPQNTDPNAKILSWWDYGYQMSAMANRTVIVDNNTWNNTHIATVRLLALVVVVSCFGGWMCVDACVFGSGVGASVGLWSSLVHARPLPSHIHHKQPTTQQPNIFIYPLTLPPPQPTHQKSICTHHNPPLPTTKNIPLPCIHHKHPTKYVTGGPRPGLDGGGRLPHPRVPRRRLRTGACFLLWPALHTRQRHPSTRRAPRTSPNFTLMCAGHPTRHITPHHT